MPPAPYTGHAEADRYARADYGGKAVLAVQQPAGVQTFDWPRATFYPLCPSAGAHAFRILGDALFVQRAALQVVRKPRRRQLRRHLLHGR